MSTQYTIPDKDNIIVILNKDVGVLYVEKTPELTGNISKENSISIDLAMDKNIYTTSGATVGFVSQAQWLIIEKIAGEDIESLRMIRFKDSSTIVYSKSDSTFTEARPIGITITSSPKDGVVKVLILGIVESNLFNYPPGSLLFLGPNGTITNNVPTAGYSVVIGESLAVGVINLSIRTPIKL